MAKKYVPLFEEFCGMVNEISSGRKLAAKSKAMEDYGINANAMYPNILDTSERKLYEDGNIFVTAKVTKTPSEKIMYRAYEIDGVNDKLAQTIIITLQDGEPKFIHNFCGDRTEPSGAISEALLNNRKAFEAICSDLNDSINTNFTWKDLVKVFVSNNGVIDIDVVNEEPAVNEEPVNEEPAPRILGI